MDSEHDSDDGSSMYGIPDLPSEASVYSDAEDTDEIVCVGFRRGQPPLPRRPPVLFRQTFTDVITIEDDADDIEVLN